MLESQYRKIKADIQRQKEKLFGKKDLESLEELIEDQAKDRENENREFSEYWTPPKKSLSHMELTERAVYVLKMSGEFSFNEIGQIFKITPKQAERIYRAA